MTIPCPHPRKGRVTSHPTPRVYVDGPHASTQVCDSQECIAAAKAWVTRMTRGLEAHYVDEVDRKFELEGDEHEQVWVDRP